MKILSLQIPVPASQNDAQTDSSCADLTAYLLDALVLDPKKKRPAIVLCPGGGYGRLSDREDQPVAMEYLAMGCQVFVLHYSVEPSRFPKSLLELAASVALIRRNSEEWHVNPEEIIVSGFSAGGHLACSLGVFWNKPFVFEALGLSAQDIRPDGMILCYPVITSGEKAHANSFLRLLGEEAGSEERRRLVSLELQVGPHTPKTFLWHTFTDPEVPVENSLLLAEAMARHQVNLELHIFPAGGHGLSLANPEISGPDKAFVEPQCQNWIKLVKLWIETQCM